MTLFGWGSPRHFSRLPAPTVRYFDIKANTRVVAACHWQPEPWDRPTILTLHGLNGSAESHYMKGIADKAFARGMNVVRLNQRNCGNTEHLSEGLFHSGLTEDARHVIHELSTVDGLTSIAVAGYSLGGNLALKLAGEYGTDATGGLDGGSRGVTDHRDRRVHARARADGELPLRVELRARAEEADGAEGTCPARPVRPDSPETHPHRARVRQRVHGAALRVRRRGRLLRQVQRDARRRPHRGSGADHHGGRRSVRAAEAVPQPGAERTTRTSICGCRRTADTAASWPCRRPGNDGYWAETQIVAFVEARHAARERTSSTAEPLEQLAATL